LSTFAKENLTTV